MVSEEDDQPQENQQCVSKIASFIAEAKTAHEYPIYIKTSKRNKIFSLKELQHQPWTTNKFKNHFEYSTVCDQM